MPFKTVAHSVVIVFAIGGEVEVSINVTELSRNKVCLSVGRTSLFVCTRLRCCSRVTHGQKLFAH